MADRATPQWTVPLREQTSGLDHLGLGSVGNQQVLVRLLPDIYVQTVHPGYLSFYAFVLDEFWRRDDLPRTRVSWRKFYRSKEVVFSVAANMCEHPDYDGDFGSIVGSNRTRDLAGDPPTGGIDTGLDYMKSAFGGYGLYYRSPMVAMGLVYPAPENGQPVDLPTERGQELAEAFRERIAKTVYWKRHSGPSGFPLELSLATAKSLAHAAFGTERPTSTPCAMSTSMGVHRRRAPRGEPR
jgi:hypothetical protein